MNGRVPTEDVEGTVEAVNRTGLKIGGAWLNVSQFGPKVELPDAGAHVRLSVDSRGYIKDLEILSESSETGVCSIAQSGDSPIGESARQQTIARLAVLKAAASFGASRPDLKSGDVLRIADSWLQWIVRED